MLARRVTVLLLGLLGGLLYVTGAFLPGLVREGFVFRQVDLSRAIEDWVPSLAQILVAAGAFVIPSIIIAVRGRSPLASGVLLGVSVVPLVQSALADLASDAVFEPGLGLWLTLIGEATALSAAILSLTVGETRAETPTMPPPPID